MKYKIINKKKLAATIILDALGRIFFSVFSRTQKMPYEDGQIKKILVIRTAYVGDVVMTIPILKPLKEKFPRAQIDFLTDGASAELLKGNPCIHRVYRFKAFWFYKSSFKEYLETIRLLKQENYDLIIEARGDIRDLMFIVSRLTSRIKLSYSFGGGAYLLTHEVPFGKIKHRVEYHLDLVRFLGCKADGLDWNVYLEPAETAKIDRLLKANGIQGPFIAIHPGSRLPLKMWLPDRYAQLCNRIHSLFNLPVVILGVPDEKKFADHIVSQMNFSPVNLVSQLSIRELAALIARAQLFICNDSAPMHVAAAMKTATVAIFGPSKSEETKPYGNVSKVVEKDFACRKFCDESTCKHPTYQACMKAVSVDDVYDAVCELIK